MKMDMKKTRLKSAKMTHYFLLWWFSLTPMRQDRSELSLLPPCRPVGIADRLPEGQRGDVERALPHHPDGSLRPCLPPRRHPRTQGRPQALHRSPVCGRSPLSDCVCRLHLTVFFLCVLGTLRVKTYCWKTTWPSALPTLVSRCNLKQENQQETLTDRWNINASRSSSWQ